MPIRSRSRLVAEWEMIPTHNLARLSLSRGRYGHAKEGAFLGFLFGGITGFVLAGDGDGGQWEGLQRVAGFMIGSLVGFATGGLAGAALQTEVWSDVRPGRLGR
jgi:hypothetical protein